MRAHLRRRRAHGAAPDRAAACLPSVVAAWLYVFLYTIRDLSIAILLAGPKSQVIAVVILESVEQWRGRRAMPRSAVLMAAAVTALAATLMLAGAAGGIAM